MEDRSAEDGWIELITKNYPRYKGEAYVFVMLVIDEIQNSLKVPRHISGEILLDGLRIYASSRYGPMAKEVLNSWGIFETEDVGNIVFRLVDYGILDKTAEDSIEDFRDRYDFTRVFEEDYFNNEN
ncbi:MAG: hypothetical protein JW814_07740 [Candidatus Krumholzibacteriota bacterium]|nr:hypothetical protein [Candidatus Krumholzibacteriota bacterium]